MGTLSTWELRKRLAEDGGGVSDRGIAEWVQWGLLREPVGGRWSDDDLARAREVQGLASETRPLPRRALRLYGEGYPMPPNKLRDAMKAVASTVTAPARKIRRVEDAIRLRYETVGPTAPRRRTDRRAWRHPKDRWIATLDRFNDADFERLAQYAYSEAIALHLSPAVQSAGILSDVPFEEVWLVLTLMQLTALGVEQRLDLLPSQENVEDSKQVIWRLKRGTKR